MKKHQSHIFFKTTVGLFILAYLISCSSNMVCIPRYVPDAPVVSIGPRPSRGQEMSANFSNINFLQVFDKSTFDNDGPNELTLAPKSIDLGFRFRNEPVELITLYSPKNHPYNNYQYSYLSFCTFRI